MSMKKCFYIGLGCTLLLAFVSLFFAAGGKAYSQETEFQRLLLERLQAQNVPVKSVTIGGKGPYQLEILLQSASSETEVAPEDPAYIHAVQREAAILYATLEINIDTIQISILNHSTASVLFWGEFPITTISPLSQAVTTNTGTIDEISGWIASNYLDTTGMTIRQLDLSTSDYGQEMLLELSAPTIDSANKAISNIMTNRWVLVGEIKEYYGIELVVLKIKVLNHNEKVLLDHTLDIQLGQENWWMDDNINTDWFPQPLPADGS